MIKGAAYVLRCGTCGARSVTENAALIGTTCNIPQDGGGVCRGLLRVESESPQAISRAELVNERLEAIYAYADLLEPLTGIVEFRRGGEIENGRSTATVVFRNAFARGAFANLMVKMGKKVVGA